MLPLLEDVEAKAICCGEGTENLLYLGLSIDKRLSSAAMGGGVGVLRKFHPEVKVHKACLSLRVEHEIQETTLFQTETLQ